MKFIEECNFIEEIARLDSFSTGIIEFDLGNAFCFVN